MGRVKRNQENRKGEKMKTNKTTTIKTVATKLNGMVVKAAADGFFMEVDSHETATRIRGMAVRPEGMTVSVKANGERRLGIWGDTAAEVAEKFDRFCR